MGLKACHIAPAVGKTLFVHAHEHIDAICLMELSHCRRQFLWSPGRFDGSQYVLDMLPGRGIARFLVGNALIQVGYFLFRRPLVIGSLMAGNVFNFPGQEFFVFQIPFVEPGPRGFCRFDLLFRQRLFIDGLIKIVFFTGCQDGCMAREHSQYGRQSQSGTQSRRFLCYHVARLLSSYTGLLFQCRIGYAIGRKGSCPVAAGTANAAGSVAPFIAAPGQFIGSAEAQAFFDDAGFIPQKERRFQMARMAGPFIDSRIHGLFKFRRAVRIGSAGGIIGMGAVVNDFGMDTDSHGGGKGQEQTVAEGDVCFYSTFSAGLGQLLCIGHMGNLFIVISFQERAVTVQESLGQIDFLLLHAIIGRHVTGSL